MTLDFVSCMDNLGTKKQLFVLAYLPPAMIIAGAYLAAIISRLLLCISCFLFPLFRTSVADPSISHPFCLVTFRLCF